MVETLKLTDANGQQVEVPVGQIMAAVAKLFTITSKGNLEITSEKNINLEPIKNLKIKPGDGGQIEMLPDHTGDLTEVVLKVQRSIDEDGSELSKEVPVRLKINSTETEFSTKGSVDDSINSYDLKFKTGLKESASGEHYCQTKLKGRSFDIRCYEHGGIALQPCGKDSDGHENKIKFESSRSSALGESPEYGEEGGKGLEFATFNNEHTSIFTGDYRFNKDAPVFAVKRGDPVLLNDKFDYPTQADDFKDIFDSSVHITWADIINAVAYVKNNHSQEDGYEIIN